MPAGPDRDRAIGPRWGCVRRPRPARPPGRRVPGTVRRRIPSPVSRRPHRHRSASSRLGHPRLQRGCGLRAAGTCHGSGRRLPDIDGRGTGRCLHPRTLVAANGDPAAVLDRIADQAAGGPGPLVLADSDLRISVPALLDLLDGPGTRLPRWSPIPATSRRRDSPKRRSTGRRWPAHSRRRPTRIRDEGEFPGDILIENGKVRMLGQGLPVPAGAEVHDASGLLVMPGAVDVHTHLDWEFGGARRSTPSAPARWPQPSAAPPA